MATNNFFGYTSHGEAGTYPGQAAAYPSVTSLAQPVSQTAAAAQGLEEFCALALKKGYL